MGYHYLSRYQLWWLIVIPRSLKAKDSLELVEDDDELELDDLDENLVLLDDDYLVATLTCTLARLCVGCKNTIAKAKRIAGRVKAKIR